MTSGGRSAKRLGMLLLIDALARGLPVTVLADAVACQSDVTRARALAKLGHLGAEVAYGDGAALAAPD